VTISLQFGRWIQSGQGLAWLLQFLSDFLELCRSAVRINLTVRSIFSKCARNWPCWLILSQRTSLKCLNSAMNVLEWLFVPSHSYSIDGESNVLSSLSKVILLVSQQATVRHWSSQLLIPSTHTLTQVVSQQAMRVLQEASKNSIQVDVVSIRIEETFKRHYTDQQNEVYYYFRLPSHAAVTNFTVWSGNNAQKSPKVIPRGAASKVYSAGAKNKSDPALMEEMPSETGEYKIRIMPSLFSSNGNSESTISLSFTYNVRIHQSILVLFLARLANKLCRHFVWKEFVLCLS